MKLKVCIISEAAYPYLKGGSSGGAELQMSLLAKYLVNRGHEVSLIHFGKSDSFYEKIENINVFCPYNYKNSGYNHFLPKNLFKYLSLLKKIDADVYIQRSGPLTTPIIGLSKKLFIFSASSDSNVSSMKIKSLKELKNIVHTITIKTSSCVFCQTNNQEKLLLQNYNKKGKVIKNLYLPSNYISVKNPQQILWVGRLIKSKNPEKYLDLAEKLPNYHFKMICGLSPGNDNYFKEIKEKSKQVENLEFLGSVPREKIDKHYSESYFLINTSSSEGFPNTFLEAWANKVPVISLNFDPDCIIHKNRLGLNCNNFNELIENTQKMIKNNSLREEMGINGFNYVSREHSINKIMSEYENAFKTLIKKFRN